MTRPSGGSITRPLHSVTRPSSGITRPSTPQKPNMDRSGKDRPGNDKIPSLGMEGKKPGMDRSPGRVPDRISDRISDRIPGLDRRPGAPPKYGHHLPGMDRPERKPHEPYRPDRDMKKPYIPKYVHHDGRPDKHHLPPPPPKPRHHHYPQYYRPIIPALPLWYYPITRGYYPFRYSPVRYYAGWSPVYNPIYPWWITGGVNVGVGIYVPPRPVYYYPQEGNTYITNNYFEGQDEDLPGVVVQDNGVANVPPPPRKTSVLNQDLDLTAEEAPQAPAITKEQIDTAWKKIQEADTAFAANNLKEAMKGYQSVADSIPQMPDPWIRMAVASVAQGDYNSAMDAANRGMTLSTGWPCSPFSLDYMYQQNTDQKVADLSDLDTITASYPENSHLAFLTGMMFYFDGQAQKATIHLNESKRLLPDLEDFVNPMITNLEEAEKTQKK